MRSPYQMTIDEFTKIKGLGRGAYGKVDLYSRDNQLYAIKKLSYTLLMQTNKYKSVFREKEILENNTSCLFLPKIHQVFKNNQEDTLYIVMEYIEGGSM